MPLTGQDYYGGMRQLAQMQAQFGLALKRLIQQEQQFKQSHELAKKKFAEQVEYWKAQNQLLETKVQIEMQRAKSEEARWKATNQLLSDKFKEAKRQFEARFTAEQERWQKTFDEYKKNWEVNRQAALQNMEKVQQEIKSMKVDDQLKKLSGQLRQKAQALAELRFEEDKKTAEVKRKALLKEIDVLTQKIEGMKVDDQFKKWQMTIGDAQQKLREREVIEKEKTGVVQREAVKAQTEATKARAEATRAQSYYTEAQTEAVQAQTETERMRQEVIAGGYESLSEEERKKLGKAGVARFFGLSPETSAFLGGIVIPGPEPEAPADISVKELNALEKTASDTVKQYLSLRMPTGDVVSTPQDVDRVESSYFKNEVQSKLTVVNNQLTMMGLKSIEASSIEQASAALNSIMAELKNPEKSAKMMKDLGWTVDQFNQKMTQLSDFEKDITVKSRQFAQMREVTHRLNQWTSDQFSRLYYTNKTKGTGQPLLASKQQFDQMLGPVLKRFTGLMNNSDFVSNLQKFYSLSDPKTKEGQQLLTSLLKEFNATYDKVSDADAQIFKAVIFSTHPAGGK